MLWKLELVCLVPQKIILITFCPLILVLDDFQINCFFFFVKLSGLPNMLSFL